jgi:hypothetical protein
MVNMAQHQPKLVSTESSGAICISLGSGDSCRVALGGSVYDAQKCSYL